MRAIFLVSLISILWCSNGCTLQTVKPWEKNLLAQNKMQLNPAPLESYLDDHIYFSKEASNGGAGVGGGGCGCN